MADPHMFCATLTCALHLSSNDARIRGQGEWALLPNGLIVGRTAVNGQRYCDICARDRNVGREPTGLQLDVDVQPAGALS